MFLRKLSTLGIALSLLLGVTVVGAGAAAPASKVAAGPAAAGPNATSQLVTKNAGAASPNNTVATYQSHTWSGYAAITDQPYVAVKATYTQPTLNCATTPGGIALFWVGFDGFSNSTVEQAGTAAYCTSGTTPTANYYAWWEMYPTNYIQRMPFTVSGGDSITTSVVYTPATGNYALSVTNVTTGQQYTKNTTCAANLTCQRLSAEWIVERPVNSDGSTYPLLAKWNTMKFQGSKAATTVNGSNPQYKVLSAFPNYRINMTNQSSAPLANAGVLNTAGNSFTDTWVAAQ